MLRDMVSFDYHLECHMWYGNIDKGRNLKECYINNLFEDEETGILSKNFWQTVKAKRRDQAGIPPLQKW